MPAPPAGCAGRTSVGAATAMRSRAAAVRAIARLRQHAGPAAARPDRAAVVRVPGARPRAGWPSPRPTVVGSTVFGLWHVRPTAEALAVNRLATGRGARITAVAAVAAGTAGAGGRAGGVCQ